MSDKNDTHNKVLEDFLNSLGVPADELPATQSSEPDASDSFYEGFDPPVLTVQQPMTLDQISKLDPESAKQIALATALAQQATEDPAPMLRKGTLTNPVLGMTDESRLIEFVNQTRRKTVEKIEDDIVNQSTPLMLWKLREFALMGKYTETRAIEIWLNWAAKISSRPKKAETDPTVLKNGALFDATLSNAQVLEAQAKAVPRKQRSKNFSTAGDFIGKFKAPKAKTGAAPKAKKGDK